MIQARFRIFWELASIPVLSGPGVSSNGTFQMSLTGEIGRSYRVQATTNLAAPVWEDVSSLTNTAASMHGVDATATNFWPRYYRAVSP